MLKTSQKLKFLYKFGWFFEKKLSRSWIMEFDLEISMNIALIVYFSWDSKVKYPWIEQKTS